MKTLTILFLGICLMDGRGDGKSRTAIVLDLRNGTTVHGHRIEPHRAFIRVLKAEDGTTWPSHPHGKYLRFDLDGEKITLDGLPPDTEPLDIKESYSCLVPKLKEECPEMTGLKPPDDLKREAAAWMLIDRGKLCGAVTGTNGPIASVLERKSNGNVTIIGEKNGVKKVIVVAAGAEVAIVNEPEQHGGVANHFLAYYELAANDACCTNTPFLPPRNGCNGAQPCRRLDGDPDQMSTVACSNSNYP